MTMTTPPIMKARSMGAHRNFSRGVKSAWTSKNYPFFGAPKARTEIFEMFWRFRLNLTLFEASHRKFQGILHASSM